MAIYAAINRLEAKGNFVIANFNPDLTELGPEFVPALAKVRTAKPAKPASKLFAQLDD